MRNCDATEKPTYYTLPDGTQFEDALYDYVSMFHERLSGIVSRAGIGAFWDACVYLHRAGRKDGEPWAKDIRKVRHYCRFIVRRNGGLLSERAVYREIRVAVGTVRGEHSWIARRNAR